MVESLVTHGIAFLLGAVCFAGMLSCSAGFRQAKQERHG